MPRTLLSQLGPKALKTDQPGPGMAIGCCWSAPCRSGPPPPGRRGRAEQPRPPPEAPAGLSERLITELELLEGPESLGAAGLPLKKPAYLLRTPRWSKRPLRPG
jgi:hypothetical protein